MTHTARQLRPIAQRALAAFDPDATLTKLYNHGENTVYRVGNRPWVLRVHRADYHPLPALLSELDVLEAVHSAGFRVGRPQRTLDGDRVATVEGRTITVLERLDGTISNRMGPSRARSLGATLAALHRWSRTWTPPPGFRRPLWDRAGLYGTTAYWGPLEHAGVDPLFMADLRAYLDLTLEPLADDVLFVHHDLHRANVLWNGNTPGLIDWDDAGFGYPLVDLRIATRRLSQPRRQHLVDGFGGLSPQQEALLPTIDLALLARAVGWLHSRRDVPRIAAFLEPERARLMKTGRAAMEST